MSLHIFSKLQARHLEQCIDNCSQEDAIVFIGAAADEILKSHTPLLTRNCRVFLLSENVTSAPKDSLQFSRSTKDRGLTEINQEGFVQLTTLHNPLVSW